MPNQFLFIFLYKGKDFTNVVITCVQSHFYANKICLHKKEGNNNTALSYL